MNSLIIQFGFDVKKFCCKYTLFFASLKYTIAKKHNTEEINVKDHVTKWSTINISVTISE